MDEDTIFTLVVVGVIGLFGVILWWAGVQQGKAFQWALALAKRLGLTVVGGDLGRVDKIIKS